jgi:hypothetical protein
MSSCIDFRVNNFCASGDDTGVFVSAVYMYCDEGTGSLKGGADYQLG